MGVSNSGDHDDEVPGRLTPPDKSSNDADQEPSKHSSLYNDLADEIVDKRFADLISSLTDLDTTASKEPSDTTDTPAHPPTNSDVGLRIADDEALHSSSSYEPTGGPRDWPTSPEVEELEEQQSHFTPPEPEPLLNDKDPLLTMAWAAVAGIPLLTLVSLIVVAAIPALNVPATVGYAGIGLFLTGLAVLVWRLPHHRDPDDSDGPGAVV